MKKKWIYLALLLIAIVGFGVYKYVYQEHRDIAKEAPAFVLSSQELVDAFKNNEAAATTKYLNKTLEVSGQVSNFSETSVTLDNAIFFALSEKSQLLTETLQGTEVAIKGRCIGYDDLLEELKFDQATLSK